MIVWGGHDGTSAVASGASYDPAADRWTPLPTAGAPSARTSHGGAWTGNEVLIFGGPVDRSGGRFDPETDTWSAMTTTGAPEWYGAGATLWTGAGMFAFGGSWGAVNVPGGIYH
jgi:hypothetical protein